MSQGRWWQCAALLVLVGAPLSLDGLRATSYGGWPSLGFAIALFLVAGRERFLAVLAAETLVIGVALTYSYHVPPLLGFVATLTVTLPAMLTWRLLTGGRARSLRLDLVDSVRYHVATAASAALCGLTAMAVATTVMTPPEVLTAGLMSFLAALTAQLVVLPLMIRTSGIKAAGGFAELLTQRVVLLVITIAVFWPHGALSVVFLVFPPLAWAAIRATRRETHIQLFLVCSTAYALTFSGHGPLAVAPEQLPEPLNPALIYLFVGAACYLIVPLTLTVEQLFAMTRQATRAATTVALLVDAATHTMFIATDEAGRITHYNVGAQRTLGYAEHEVHGGSPSMFHTPEEIARHADYFAVPADHRSVVLAQNAKGERRDWAFLRKDGTERMASLSVSEVTDAAGKVTGYIHAGEDITERLRTEEALTTALAREHASVARLQEVDHVKQELVSNVSHELRTPITSIAGYAELLADRALGELNRAQVEAVQRIERNTSRLGLLVEDLLTLSRAEDGQLDLHRTEIDLRDVAAEGFEILDELARGRELEVRLDVPPEPVTVHGDRHALERVVINLLGNAIKFTPDAGRATLSTRQTPSGAELIVSDTGLGIPAEDQKHLFTRFFRASAASEQAIQGTGLGLSIVHAIVTQHGGTVSVDSAPGRGTTVTVLFPEPCPTASTRA